MQKQYNFGSTIEKIYLHWITNQQFISLSSFRIDQENAKKDNLVL